MSLANIVPTERGQRWPILAPSLIRFFENSIVVEWSPRVKECNEPPDCSPEEDIGPPTRVLIYGECSDCNPSLPGATSSAPLYRIDVIVSYKRSGIWNQRALSSAWLLPNLDRFEQYNVCDEPGGDCDPQTDAGRLELFEFRNQIEFWSATATTVIGSISSFNLFNPDFDRTCQDDGGDCDPEQLDCFFPSIISADGCTCFDPDQDDIVIFRDPNLELVLRQEIFILLADRISTFDVFCQPQPPVGTYPNGVRSTRAQRILQGSIDPANIEAVMGSVTKSTSRMTSSPTPVCDASQGNILREFLTVGVDNWVFGGRTEMTVDDVLRYDFVNSSQTSVIEICRQETYKSVYIDFILNGVPLRSILVYTSEPPFLNIDRDPCQCVLSIIPTVTGTVEIPLIATFTLESGRTVQRADVPFPLRIFEVTQDLPPINIPWCDGLEEPTGLSATLAVVGNGLSIAIDNVLDAAIIATFPALAPLAEITSVGVSFRTQLLCS